MCLMVLGHSINGLAKQKDKKIKMKANPIQEKHQAATHTPVVFNEIWWREGSRVHIFCEATESTLTWPILGETTCAS